jgi:hypothetical protein
MEHRVFRLLQDQIYFKQHFRQFVAFFQLNSKILKYNDPILLNMNNMTDRQRVTILKNLYNREKEPQIREFCEKIGKSPSELDQIEAAELISNLKLAY